MSWRNQVNTHPKNFTTLFGEQAEGQPSPDKAFALNVKQSDTEMLCYLIEQVCAACRLDGLKPAKPGQRLEPLAHFFMLPHHLHHHYHHYHHHHHHHHYYHPTTTTPIAKQKKGWPDKDGVNIARFQRGRCAT